ncbi:IS701 family transposase [Streptomyces sp. SID8379]|uniref:IS701 family transposase n=1 Tax=unclassified Streptomyces TaxID=2593676 RepID=UPI00037BCDDD|nr:MULTISPECIES: IS701 family transposase [unclassified Streptomyces]MYW69313.1 IS701 family transposase [Streptomyces sp. SID8379]
MNDIQGAWLAPPEATPEQRAAEERSERLEELLEQVGRRFFRRSDLRAHAQEYLRALAGGGAAFLEDERGGASWLRQHFLGRASWNADALRDFTARYVVEGLSPGGPGHGPGDGVLVLDEVAFRKKGNASAGVARQYVEEFGAAVSCQIGVMASWSTPLGTAPVDRELYLPPDWITDAPRRRRAHVPQEIDHVTKSQLAVRIAERLLLPGGSPRGTAPQDGAMPWVVADTRLGCDAVFRSALAGRGIPHLVGVARNHAVLPHPGWRRVSLLVQRHAAEESWGRLGSGGWEWWVRRVPPEPSAGLPARAGPRTTGTAARWLVACRRTGDRHPRRYFLAHGPAHTALGELADAVAAWRESREVLSRATDSCGLGSYRVRSWQGWYRHISLAQLAAGFHAVHAAQDGTAVRSSPAVERARAA